MPHSRDQVSRHPHISLTAGMSKGALLTQTELPLSVRESECVCVCVCACVCVWGGDKGFLAGFTPLAPGAPSAVPWWHRDASRRRVWLLVPSFSPSPFTVGPQLTKIVRPSIDPFAYHYLANSKKWPISVSPQPKMTSLNVRRVRPPEHECKKLNQSFFTIFYNLYQSI